MLRAAVASLVVAVVLGLGSLAGLAQGGSPYLASLERWRADHDTSLRADDGWLSVVGLEWLKEGANHAGSAADADVRLPAGAPATIGVFRLADGTVTFEPSANVATEINGRPASQQAMRPDIDRLTSGSLSLFVIKRREKFGIRVKDRDSVARREFAGEQWYPGNEVWQVTARFEPYDPPRMIPILNVLGQVDPQPSPGAVVFTIAGKEYRLDPIRQGRQLFFIFKDLTSTGATYPAGRFLYAPMPQNGQVVLDFNKAENPPCAFTEFATCPLPPKQNLLPIAIEAGERYVRHK